MTQTDPTPGRLIDEAFPPELPRIRRYTLSGESRFEEQVHQDLSRLSADAELALAGRLRSLVLVGRFARGEGSMVERNGEAIAFGGYHCLAVAERPSHRDVEALREMERTWSGHLRVSVRMHPISLQQYAKRHHTLWWLDLARGGVELLSGDAMALSALQSIELGELPRDEIGYLLVEQVALLALALCDDTTPALVRRQRVHQLALACGDATLLLEGRFGGGLRARLSQLRSLRPATEADYYADAIDFLARPDLWQVSDEEQWQAQALRDLERWHLSIEHQRCAAPTTLANYVRYRGSLFEGSRASRTWSAKLQAWRRVLQVPPSFPYVEKPNERLARAATGLAYGRLDARSLLICTRLLNLHASPAARHQGRLLEQLLRLYEHVQEHRDDPTPFEFYA